MLVALSAVAFGSLGVLGTWAQRLDLDIPTLLGLRFAIAGFVLAAAARARREPVWPGRRAAPAIALLGLLYVGQALCYFGSLRTTPAAVTSILLYTYPVVVTLLARALLGELLTAGRMVALGLCAIGVLAVVDPLTAGSLDPVGVALGLGSAAVYSTYILCGARLLGGVGALTATTGVCLVAGAAFLIGGAVTGQLHGFDPRGWLVIAAIAVVATVLAATAFLAGLARVGAGRAAIVSTLEPVSTAALAALLLGERLGPLQVAGGALVLGGAALLGREGRAQVGREGAAPY